MEPSIITLILNIVLGVFILLGFLGGLKGIKKSTFNLVMFIIELIIIFIITPFVSKAILNISISGSTINQHIITGVNDMLGAELASGEFVKKIVESIPVMIVNIVTTILLIIVFWLIFKIIGAIVYRIMFGKDNQKVIEKCEIVNGTPQMVKKTVKKEKHRLAGGLVGAVQGFLTAVVMFFPLCGMVNIFNDVTGISAVNAETTQSSFELKPMRETLYDVIPEEVSDYAKAIDNSILFKIGKVANISELSFNLVSRTSINGESVKLGKEI